MRKQLIKGNEAILRGALLAGCRAFYSYPITPASEVGEAAAQLMPLAGGTFLQAESETAAINMLYGAASAGVRSMTASSGPGISLMQEGLSYLAAAELPCVIADMMRAGPGLGNIAPEQSDYMQVVKGGGHGSYRNIVLAPDSVQEMCNLTMLAFELADKYRNPVFVLADGCLGQMMEAIKFPAGAVLPPPPSWAVRADAATRKNLITSIQLDSNLLEGHIAHLAAKYERAEREDVRFESFLTDDAEVVLVGYGIVARVLKSVVRLARAEGLRAGLLRPITLFPFPSRALASLAAGAAVFLAVELSTGQMVEDIRLAIAGRRPVEFYGRCGGNIPSAEEILPVVRRMAERHAPAPSEPEVAYA